MATISEIEWTDATWNPLTGCTKISPGCKHCYAERMSKRLHAMGQYNYRNRFRVTTHKHTLDTPSAWKAPKTVFVNSMSDLFHEAVPDDYILKVFNVMQNIPRHNFQLLTKRSERLMELSPSLPWTPNIWMGVSVENNDYKYRINHLRKTKAKVKFLSLEPLLGPITRLPLKGIDWVIVGGESGPKARTMHEPWALKIRDQCQKKNVPFFFKQWGGKNKKKAGRLLQGKTWDEVPVIT